MYNLLCKMYTGGTKMSYILETRDLTKQYGSQKSVNSLNLKVEKGDIYGFLGPNGAGKTTTIRMILGLIRPTNGEVFIDGVSVQKDFTKAITGISGIVETPKFYENLSGYDNLKILKNFRPDIPVSRIDEVLKLVDLEEAKKKKFKTYSLGMKQRLGLAATLLNKPKIIILDEPTNGLDPQGVVEIRETIVRLAKMQELTVLISSHILHEIEIMCNKVAIIVNGNLVIEGNTHELLTSDTDVEIAVDDVSKASNVINELGEGILKKKLDDKIIISDSKIESWKANEVLVNAGVKVSAITKENKSLEQYFIETVEEGK